MKSKYAADEGIYTKEPAFGFYVFTNYPDGYWMVDYKNEMSRKLTT